MWPNCRVCYPPVCRSSEIIVLRWNGVKATHRTCHERMWQVSEVAVEVVWVETERPHRGCTMASVSANEVHGIQMKCMEVHEMRVEL